MSVQIVESDMTKELVPHDVINVKPKKKQKESSSGAFSIYVRNRLVWVKIGFADWELLVGDRLYHNVRAMGYIKVEYDYMSGAIRLSRLDDFRSVIAGWFLKDDTFYRVYERSIMEIRSPESFAEESIERFAALYGISKKSLVMVGDGSPFISEKNQIHTTDGNIKCLDDDRIEIIDYKYVVKYKSTTYKGVSRLYARTVIINVNALSSVEEEKELYYKLVGDMATLKVSNVPNYDPPCDEYLDVLLRSSR